MLPRLPPLPQTLKNLDKVGVALFDIPRAWLEGKAARIRANDAQEVEFTNAKTLKREVGAETDLRIKAVLEGLALDYLSKLRSRTRVFDSAAEELANDPPKADTAKEIDDDWMAFFKGKVDNLGNEEVRILFGKVLAGEVRAPGSFSKRSLTELDTETGRLFQRFCSISLTLDNVDIRVVTNGFGNASNNALQPYGLGYSALSQLLQAGLVVSDFNSWYKHPALTLGQSFEIGGLRYRLRVSEAKRAELNAPEEIVEALKRLDGVALSNRWQRTAPHRRDETR